VLLNKHGAALTDRDGRDRLATYWCCSMAGLLKGFDTRDLKEAKALLD